MLLLLIGLLVPTKEMQILKLILVYVTVMDKELRKTILKLQSGIVKPQSKGMQEHNITLAFAMIMAEVLHKTTPKL